MVLVCSSTTSGTFQHKSATTARTRPRAIRMATSGRRTCLLRCCSSSTRTAMNSRHVRAAADRPDHLGRGQPQPSRQDTQDYYSFSLTQGQTATVVAESLNGKAARDQHRGRQRERPGHRRQRSDQRQPVDRELRRPVDRHVLRRGHRRPGSPVQRGGHPRRRLHAPAAQLVSTAQNLTGTGGVLGYLAPPPRRSWLDDQFGDFGNARIRSSRPIRRRARSSGRRSTPRAARSKPVRPEPGLRRDQSLLQRRRVRRQQRDLRAQRDHRRGRHSRSSPQARSRR